MDCQCEICGEREAQVLIREITANKTIERRLCELCAKERGLGGSSPLRPSSETLRPRRPPAPRSGAKGNLTAQAFMRQLSEERTRLHGQCPGCGLTYAEIRRKGLLGCALCYGTFKVELKELLQRIHGAEHHQGKGPDAAPVSESAAASGAGSDAALAAVADPRELLATLRRELNEAIEKEAYELAAGLRDRIRAVEEVAGREGASGRS